MEATGAHISSIEPLGKLMLFDKDLSVNRNEACAFCHMPETGFTVPISELNRTTGSYPGSVRTRFSKRKPQIHTYAPLAPVIEQAAITASRAAGIVRGRLRVNVVDLFFRAWCWPHRFPSFSIAIPKLGSN